MQERKKWTIKRNKRPIAREEMPHEDERKKAIYTDYEENTHQRATAGELKNYLA